MAAFGIPGVGVLELGIVGCVGTVILIVVVVSLATKKSRGHSSDTATPSPQASSSPAGWLQDPTGRHQLRYWDGAAWTSTVSDDGHQADDPV